MIFLTPLVSELNFRYQQAMADRAKAERPRDIIRLELQIRKLIGNFHGHVVNQLQSIIDEYHCGRGELPCDGTRFENGPLRILFVTDYAQAGEEVIAGAYAWLRQEMNATRWIASKRPGGSFLHQPLMSVAEYKGFRALAMLALPLGEKTLIMEPAAGIIEEASSLSGTLATFAKEMNLAPYPYRLSNGCAIQLAFPPTVEVHRITKSNPGSRFVPTSSEKGRLGHQPGITATTPPGLYLANVHDLMIPYPSSDELCGSYFFRQEFIEKLPFNTQPGDPTMLRVLRDSNLPLIISRLESLEYLPLDSEEWRIILHQNGLNVALLGAIARDTKLPHIREGAIIEMLARTAKTVLRSRVRQAILHFRDVQALKVEEELVFIVLDVVNGILEASPQWIEELISAVQDHYCYSVDGEAVRNLARNALLAALQHHCALQLKETAFARQGSIQAEDFVGFSVRLTDGGSGCLGIETNDDPLIELAQIILPIGGETFWTMDGRRAAASRAITRLVSKLIDEKQWDEALCYAELAAGLCPRHHPSQIQIALAMASIRTQGPPNLAFRQPVIGNPEKAVALGAPIAEEELKRLKTTLLHRVDRHFGLHHPLGIQVRIHLARLLEKTAEGKNDSLSMRKDALASAFKVLGRRHAVSRKLLIELAEAQRTLIGGYDEAIVSYMEALKLDEDSSFSPNGSDYHTKAELYAGLSKCWQAKGDYEEALEWIIKCRDLLDEAMDIENNGSASILLETALEQIAELSQSIYAEITPPSTPAQTDSQLASLLTEELLPESIAAHLRMASACYEQLFDLRRNRHELDTADGEALLRLVRKMVLLQIRLAAPAQRPAIRATIRKKLFTRGETQAELMSREAAVRELLVRMVAGPATPKELVDRVLLRAQAVETLAEAEADLGLLLDLIELVHH